MINPEFQEFMNRVNAEQDESLVRQKNELQEWQRLIDDLCSVPLRMECLP